MNREPVFFFDAAGELVDLGMVVLFASEIN
jgi:hypothetical protein